MNPINSSLAAFALLALMPSRLAAADGRIPISGTTTITQPGHYYLTADVSSSAAGAFGVNIQANNVELDLEGHTINMTGTGSTRGIYVYNVSNILIRNGVITGAANAVQMSPAAGGLMTNVRLERLKITGGAGSAVQAFDAGAGTLSNVAVEHCQVYSNSQRTLDLTGVQGGRVEGNEFRTVNSIVVNDAYIRNSSSLEILNNRLTGGGNGITLESVTGTRVTGNSVTGTAGDGIYLLGSSGNFILNNVLTGNASGIELFSGVTGSLYNAIEGNLMTGNSSYGLIIRAGSTGNVWGRNRALNNTSANFAVAVSNRSAGDNCDAAVCTN